MRQRSWVTLTVLVAVAAGCATEATGPNAGPDPSVTGTEGLPAGLRVDFVVAPDDVVQGAPFDVTLAVTNTTDSEIEVVTAHGCLVLPHVFRDGTRLPFEGTAWGCTAAITTHRFAPGAVRSFQWSLRASLYAEHPGDEDGALAPKGTYRVRAIFDTLTDRGPAARPIVDHPLRVR